MVKVELSSFAMNDQELQQHKQQQPNLQMQQPAGVFGGGLTQEQMDTLKRHHAQAQAARQNNNNGETAAAAGATSLDAANSSAGVKQTATSNINVGQGQEGQGQGQGPYMVLTQVAVPAHMLQLTKANPSQLQQLLQQQGGSNSPGSQPQVLTFNQLPPQVQQQILLQQRLQGQSKGPAASGTQHPQPQPQSQHAHTLIWQQQQQQHPPAQTLRLSQNQTQLPQPGKGGQEELTIDDIQDLLKNNQLDVNLVQQLLSSQSDTNNSDTSSQDQNNGASLGTGNSLSEMLQSFNEATMDKETSTDASSTHKKMFLETQVQPVKRQNDTHSEDDLFKFFEVDNLVGDDGPRAVGEDALKPTTGIKNEMPNQFPNVSSFLEPTPMFQQMAETTASHVQSQSNPQHEVPVQMASSMALPGILGVSKDQHQQFQQLQRQPQHTSLSVPAQVPSQTQGPQMGGVRQEGSPASSNPTFSLPSTVVPPTVLASVCTGKATTKRPAPKKKPPSSKRTKKVDTPQDVLMRLVERQGHPELKRIKSEDAGYDTMPSPLQLSSFGTQVVQAVHTSNAEMLGKLLSCGLSPNPCNQFRDSILDLVCKRNNVAIFQCLLEHGSDLRVVDGFGRTPLHHCAWANSFSREIAESIVERDPLQLFIEDKRGQTPMEYVRADIMSEWNDFLEEMADKFWPKGGSAPKLVRPKENRPDGSLPDPESSVSAGLASMISSGRISVAQFEQMTDQDKAKFK